MTKHRESAADQVWRERRDSCLSLGETVVLLVLLATIAIGALVAS